MDKVLQMLGLCKKAGRIADGAFLAEKAIRDGRAVLIIVSNDASDNVKKKFDNASKYYKIDYMQYSTKEEIGKSLGLSPIAVCAVCDEGFKEAIEKKYSSLPKK